MSALSEGLCSVTLCSFVCVMEAEGGVSMYSLLVGKRLPTGEM